MCTMGYVLGELPLRLRRGMSSTRQRVISISCLRRYPQMFSQSRGSDWRSAVTGFDPCAALRAEIHTHTLHGLSGTFEQRVCSFFVEDPFFVGSTLNCNAIHFRVAKPFLCLSTDHS